MERLTLAYLSPYLPYGLKVLRPDRLKVLELQGLCGDLMIFKEASETYGSILGGQSKPILRPMTDLTWQILADAGDYSHKDWVTIEGDNWIALYGHEKWLNDIPYGLIQWLIKNHYDIFLLIQKGLAISIHDVKEVQDGK